MSHFKKDSAARPLTTLIFSEGQDQRSNRAKVSANYEKFALICGIKTADLIRVQSIVLFHQ